MFFFTYIAFMRHVCISNYIIISFTSTQSPPIHMLFVELQFQDNTNNTQKLLYGFNTSTHLPAHYRLHSRATNLKQSTTKQQPSKNNYISSETSQSTLLVCLTSYSFVKLLLPEKKTLQEQIYVTMLLILLPLCY